jgi:hypothetical protein
MPFPIPLLPMMVVALLVASILPAILKMCSRHEKAEDRPHKAKSDMDSYQCPTTSK